MVNYQVEFVSKVDPNTVVNVHVVITDEMNVECPSDVIDQAEIVLAKFVKDVDQWEYNNMEGE
jgi:hypothetical protein